MANNTSQVVWFEELRRADVPRVGGKNALLGEMVANLATSGVKVPPGFATTAEAYWHFVESNGLKATISSVMSELESARHHFPMQGRRSAARSCAASGRRRRPTPS
jgi:pyruvate,water dikinase